jgi:guanylate kinase
MGKGLLIVLSGPSAAGKGTVCKALIARHPEIALSISCTTRVPRCGEREGINYFFRSEAEFKQLIREDEFLEYACVYGNYYGTPKSFVASKLAQGDDVLLEIDVQGALKAKKMFPDGILIFLVPPSMEELERRIRGRATESEEQISERLSKAKSEMAQVDRYDYVIVNDHVERVVEEIESIIEAEKLRVKRAKKEFEDMRRKKP